MRIKSPITQQTKRGDTIIEIMFAFAIFTLIAIITITMMNLGLAASERSLELVTARNELNAQAEALRFIHSSYIAELTLPRRDQLTNEQLAQGVKYQQYADLWDTLTNPNNLMSGNCGAEGAAVDGCFDIEYPLGQCDTVYAHNSRQLANNNAFVLNTRELLSPLNNGGNSAIVYARTNPEIFAEPTLNARLLYTNNNPLDNSTSDDRISSLNNYTRLALAEGIWVVGVKGPVTNGGSQPQYFDFYIETCWYGPGNAAPSSLDAVIRLYNPEGA